MKLIRFVPTIDKAYLLGEPQPAKNFIPEWWKQGESTFKSGELDSPGMKACIPFLDIMMTGYMLVTPFDIFVGRKDNGELNVRWSGPEQWSDFIGERPKELGHTIPRPAGHEPNGMVWSSRWGWKTPRGYSVLVTHPFNHYDLPFTTLNAFMDSDKYFSNGNIPFFFKEGFEGRILAGTPFAQLIPVHRKSWKQVNDFGLAVETKQQGLITRENEHYYKRFLWERKSYN